MLNPVLMNKRFILFLFFSGTFFAGCVIHKKIQYNYPEHMPELEKEKLFAVFEKGRKLYTLNCSDCHGIFAKGKDGIPDFNAKQLDNYAARYLNRDPKNHAVAIHMDPEQLNDIFMFLRFRKRDGTKK